MLKQLQKKIILIDIDKFSQKNKLKLCISF